MLNNGDGTFRDGSAAANFPVLEDQGLKVIDFDLDGDFDLVYRTELAARLYRNQGGVFGAGVVVSDQTGSVVGAGLAVCDVNGDGFEDVMYAANSTTTNKGTPQVLINVNGSLLPSATQKGTTADPDALVGRNERIACGDQNRDGMPDALTRWGEAYRLMRGANPLFRTIRLRIVGGDEDRNQQGRVVRIVPESQPDRIMTRVVESGSGLRSQGLYDLLIGAPWPGDYEVTVRFAAGEVTATVEAGDQKLIFAGRPRRGHQRRRVGAQPSAASRSATRSSASSIPIESRTSESLMPSLARDSGGTEACVMIAGWSTRLSTPPRLSASVNTSSRSRKRRASGSAALQEEGHDSAAALRHLALRERVLRMRGQARIEHPLDPRVLLEPRGNRERRLARLAHAQRQRLEPAQRQEAVEGPADGADRVLQEADALAELRVADDGDAADHVRVAVQELGRRVHDDVRAELERALYPGRREGVVHDHQDAAAARRPATTAAMSTSFSSGLVGVSIQIMRVFGPIAAAAAFGSERSAKVKSRFAERRRTRSNRRKVPP